MSSRHGNTSTSKAQRKAQKKAQKQDKSVKFDTRNEKSDSEPESPDEAAPVAGNKQAATSQAGSLSSAKRTRTSPKTSMVIDFAASSKNSSNPPQKTIDQFHPENDQQAQQKSNVDQTSSSGKSTSTVTADQGNQPLPTNKETSPANVDKTNGNNSSRHAYETQDDDVEMFVDVDDVTKPRFRAAVPIRHVLINKESRKALRNRLNDYFVSDFTSFKECYLRGSIETGLAVAIFFEETDRNRVISNSHPRLKLDNVDDPPVFHTYDPAAIQSEIKSRSVTVRDIPLSLSKADIENTYKRYGLVESVKTRIPHNSLFQVATVVFDNAKDLEQFHLGKWCTFTKGSCLRNYPSTFTREQEKLRQQFTLVLRNLPYGICAYDLIDVYTDTSAVLIGLPIHSKSLKNKPWAYFAFKTEEALQNAKDIQRILRGKELVWDLPENVKKFCLRCSSPEHSAKDCDNVQSRGRKPTPKHIAAAYRRYNHDVPSSRGRNNNFANNNNNNNRRSNSNNRAHSNSRSRSRSRNYNNNNNNKKSYADVASSSTNTSLNASIHAPSNNSNNNKGKGKQVNNDVNPQLINTLTKAMDRLEFLTGQLTVWQLAIKNLDKRIIRIEQTLELAPIEQQEKQAPKSVQPPPSNTSSDNNFNKSSATNNNKNDALASIASNSNADR